MKNQIKQSYQVLILLSKEFREAFLNSNKIPAYLFSLGIMAFIFWNLSRTFSSFMTIPGSPRQLIVMLSPSYLVCLFSIMLIRDFAVEKKTGVIEALLSTGVRQEHIIIARSCMIFVVSAIETIFSLLWFEILTKMQIEKTLLPYITWNENMLVMLSLICFSWIFIVLITTLVFYYNHVMSYILPISLTMTFIYSGFFYGLQKLPMVLNLIIVAAACIFVIYLIHRIMQCISIEKLIME